MHGVDNQKLPVCFSRFLRCSSSFWRAASESPPGCEGVSSPLWRILVDLPTGKLGTTEERSSTKHYHTELVRTFEERLIPIVHSRLLPAPFSICFIVGRLLSLLFGQSIEPQQRCAWGRRFYGFGRLSECVALQWILRNRETQKLNGRTDTSGFCRPPGRIGAGSRTSLSYTVMPSTG